MLIIYIKSNGISNPPSITHHSSLITHTPSQLHARMSETTGTAFRLSEHIYLLPYGLLMAGNYHLGDSFSVLNHKCFRRKIYEDNTDFTAVVCIDSTRRIQYRVFLDSQTAAGTNLRLKPSRQSDVQTCRNRQRCNGSKAIGSERLARMSIPADNSVAYAGNGCFDLFIIRRSFTIICHFNEVTIEITLIHYLTGKITDFEANSHTFAVK